VDFDGRHFIHAQHIVPMEIALLHAAAVDGDAWPLKPSFQYTHIQSR
jgi:hypothetical protein